MGGRTIHELAVGDRASFSKTITEVDIWAFAAISGDFNPVHVDEEYARRTFFKRRIAHGPVALSLIAPVLGMILPGPGTIAIDVYARFIAPVYPNDTITVTAEVAEIDTDENLCTIQCEWRNQEEKLVLEGRVRVSPPRRKAAASD
ncbi:MAG: MaoC family dehydratase [Syntrophomonadaceae bacterium]|nr:MaoC family dehydratase [Syntrophomonadaceae bacterium]